MRSDIRVEIHIDDPELAVLVDPVQLERSLYNLLLNARDAMPEGGLLTIHCRRAEPSRAAISVGDSGHGMDSETLAHIFEPFFTTKDVGKGTGLGLASVKAFATQAGGDVRVASELGRGTTFTLELPEQRPGAVAEQPPQSVQPRVARPDRPVLVVEDRADVRASIVRTLTQGGFRVAEAEDGSAALALLHNPGGFSLLCIDGVMPGTATADVLKRASEIDSNLPVLLCSGHVQEDLVRRGIETGRYAFLEKPFSTKQLLDKVHEVLAPTRARND